MKDLTAKHKSKVHPIAIGGSDKTKPDDDADKSGTDKDSDKTEKKPSPEKDRFDKPKREVDPDTTEIDIVPSTKESTPPPLPTKKNISK